MAPSDGNTSNNETKIVELEDEIEGGNVGTTDYYFDRIGEPVPIKPHDSNFDVESPPSQPLAVSELHGLIFVAHSCGFCVARIKDVIASAKDIKDKGSGSSIQELSVVDVPIGKVHILAISAENSTLAASIDRNVHFFPLNSLLNKVRYTTLPVTTQGTTHFMWATPTGVLHYPFISVRPSSILMLFIRAAMQSHELDQSSLLNSYTQFM